MPTYKPYLQNLPIHLSALAVRNSNPRESGEKEPTETLPFRVPPAWKRTPFRWSSPGSQPQGMLAADAMLRILSFFIARFEPATLTIAVYLLRDM